MKFKLFEIDGNGDAVLNSVFDNKEDAIEASNGLFSYQIEVDFGWGSQVLERVIVKLGHE